MNEIKNDRILRALARKKVDCTPVWMMRQAGRYLPEYRKVRTSAGGFMDLCTNPDLACEVTLQPLERFDLDAAILFSDILTIPDAMGLGLFFEVGEGPKFKNPVRTAAEIEKLEPIDAEKDLGYVMDAVRTIHRELNGRVPLIGFSGSPWTLATYMIEGGSSRDFRFAKELMFTQPEVLHQLLSVLAESVVSYLNAQIAAGAEIVQIFDTWGGVLSGPGYEAFSLAYMTQIISGLEREARGRRVPVIIFTKGGGQWLESMVNSGADCLGLDWTTDIGFAQEQVGNQVALQGNMDPSVLLGSPQVIEQEVGRILARIGSNSGHVFNLGHGISQFADPANAAVFVDAVHELSAEYHGES